MAVLIAVLASACSIQRLAMNSLSDALASGADAFESDNDPEFVEQALPFTLKMIDGLLLRQPNHRQLLLAGASGYVMYAYAYIAVPAERAGWDDIDRARELRARARNLFLRAHDYASRALELSYPDLGVALLVEPETALTAVGEGDPGRDVEMLYWTAAALGLAISESRNEPELLARLPEVEALLERALQLDEDWRDGSLHQFAIQLAGVSAADEPSLRRHYDRALALSAGRRASLHVAFAEAVAVPRQDRAEFVALLERALAVDIDADPTQRLANVIAQRRARWLMSHLNELFLE